uniref:Uncharacterized protein n=1 Tax=Tanacetum cinerariifolium TaxID=118510 RepID=A0A6L2LYH4_TANCI|nr:hypothetical protein [Tanacetum cinerariifolium]
MTSFDYRLKPLYTIKECSSCGAFYITDYCCSDGSLVDKIICDLNKAPDSPHLHMFSTNQRHCFQCKDMLGDGEFYQRCTCMRCGSGLSKGLCLICENNQNSPSISENSSQSPPHIIHHCCYGCGDLLDESMKNLRIAFQAWSENIQQKKEEEEKQIAEEQAAKARYWKIHICYDDDEDYTIAITPKEPDNTLSMSDDESFSDEDISKKIYSNPLFDEEIISMKIDPHHFNVESDLIESLLSHDSLIISSSSKIDSLLDEFADELIFLKSIPLRINETDCDPEEEIRLTKKLFMITHLIVHQKNLFLKILMLQSNLYLHLLSPNDSLSLPEYKSIHFDIRSSSCPPTKPPDGNSGILNVKVMGDNSEHNVPMPRLMLTQPTLVPNQEKSPNLLSHQGHEAF